MAEPFIINVACFLLGMLISVFVLLIMFFKIKNIIRQDFAQIANLTIKNEQEDLRKQNREALDEKLKPLSKELSEFKHQVESFNVSGVENTTKILTQLNILEKNNRSIEQEAKNLTEALTKNQNIKGAYGENLLDMILQNSGLCEGVHYTKQYTSESENLKDETIHKIRPDVVINLPNHKHLIIDSKVTLTSYLEYIKDNSKLKDFKAEVKKRLTDLANKNYQNAVGTNQPDFILMYMPIDASVNLVYEDYELINYAYKSNVIIVGTASLLVAIRLVSQLFTQQRQNENIEKIVNAGHNLYDTFVQLCNELVEIQKNLVEINEQFTTAINRFQRGNKNKPSLFSQVNELKKYGINSNKDIPKILLNELTEEVNING